MSNLNKMNLKKNILIFVIILGFGILPTKILAQDTPNFKDLLTRTLAQSKRAGQTGNQGIKLSEVCNVDEDAVAARVFADYGAMFVAALKNPSVKFPNNCILDSNGVQTYQQKASPTTQTIGRVQITLQKPAMDALLEAIAEARQKNLTISPRGGSEAASRSYEDTLRLWNTRFVPGLNYWVKKGKISRADAETVKRMQIHDQVNQVLEWESQRLYFSTAFDKSILYSVAAPGTSQHIFMLALDVAEFSNKAVRDILAKHGWFQTVQSDLPHFTYLGASRDELSKYGLVRKVVSGQEFWIPNLEKAIEVKCIPPVYSTSNSDPGYDYVDVLTNNAIFTSIDGNNSKTLRKSQKLVLVSRSLFGNNSYKVVDLDSYEIGFVKCNSIKVFLTLTQQDENLFVKERARNSYSQPSAVIRNSTDRLLILFIDDSKYLFPANTEKTITLSPGPHSFVAVANGVKPLVGSDIWELGFVYKWTFYINTR